MTFTTGMRIGKYELGRKLGQGGFGLVFVARDTGLDRDVALKFLHPEHTASAEILRRFLQEARSAAKIAHPGIVTVFECGQVTGSASADGVAYIAMELLHGESLSDRLQRAGRLDVDHAIEITRQVASALEAAHAAGIIHRDLKPDNIFLVRDPAMPGGERVKVLDFGIAKLAQGAQSGVQTQSMMVFGTPRYMSPEQCRSAAHIDHRSDIYTLGCILYELVVGAPPFTGETGELIAKHQLVAPMTAKSIIGDLPEDLDALITSMLAKNPADRPQTMTAVQRALEARGALQAGVAPTLAPDASLPRITPAAGYRARKSAPIGAASAPTTLGGASGQWDGEPVARRSKLPLVIGASVLAAGIAVVAIVLATRDKAAPTQPAAAPPPIVHDAAAPTPPPPTTDIELAIEATPKAEVWSPDGRVLLGETPYTEKRAKAERGKIGYLLKAAGHKDRRVFLAADASDKQAVTLEPLPVPTASAPPKKQRKPKPAGVGDRDNDRIPDAKDKCPDERERYNGYQDDDGCKDLRPGELPDE